MEILNNLSNALVSFLCLLPSWCIVVIFILHVVILMGIINVILISYIPDSTKVILILLDAVVLGSPIIVLANGLRINGVGLAYVLALKTELNKVFSSQYSLTLVEYNTLYSIFLFTLGHFMIPDCFSAIGSTVLSIIVFAISIFLWVFTYVTEVCFIIKILY